MALALDNTGYDVLNVVVLAPHGGGPGRARRRAWAVGVTARELGVGRGGARLAVGAGAV